MGQLAGRAWTRGIEQRASYISASFSPAARGLVQASVSPPFSMPTWHAVPSFGSFSPSSTSSLYNIGLRRPFSIASITKTTVTTTTYNTTNSLWSTRNAGRIARDAFATARYVSPNPFLLANIISVPVHGSWVPLRVAKV